MLSLPRPVWRRTVLCGLLALGVLALVGCQARPTEPGAGQEGSAASPTPGTGQTDAVPAHTPPVLGQANAPITLVEWGDFQ